MADSLPPSTAGCKTEPCRRQKHSWRSYDYAAAAPPAVHLSFFKVGGAAKKFQVQADQLVLSTTLWVLNSMDPS